MAFVFIDENPWGIDDGFFVCDPIKPVWINIPASYHNGAGGLSFADGHAEIKKWKDSAVLNCSAPPPLGVQQDASTGNLGWLQERSSSADAKGANGRGAQGQGAPSPLHGSGEALGATGRIPFLTSRLTQILGLRQNHESCRSNIKGRPGLGTCRFALAGWLAVIFALTLGQARVRASCARSGVAVCRPGAPVDSRRGRAAPRSATQGRGDVLRRGALLAICSG